MNKDLKRMGRAELLEILISQIEENERLKRELKECKKELEDRKIKIDNAGSLAEAAVKLNGLFEAADAAVKQYVENAVKENGAESTQISVVPSYVGEEKKEKTENKKNPESIPVKETNDISFSEEKNIKEESLKISEVTEEKEDAVSSEKTPVPDSVSENDMDVILLTARERIERLFKEADNAYKSEK